MRPIITVTAVVLLHLCVIAVLVGVNGCRSTSGFEQPGDLAAYSGGARAAGSSAAPVPVPVAVVPAPANIEPIQPVGPGGVHTVINGETLNVVATREKVTVAALAAANGLPLNAVIKAGQKLKIPAAKQVPAKAPAPKSKAAPAKPVAAKAPAAAAPTPAFTPLKIVPLSAAAPKQDPK